MCSGREVKLMFEPYIETAVHDSGRVEVYRPMLDGDMWRKDGVYRNEHPSAFTYKNGKYYYLTQNGAYQVAALGGRVRGEIVEADGDEVAVGVSEDEKEKYFVIGEDEIGDFLPNVDIPSLTALYGYGKYRGKYLASICVKNTGSVEKAVYFWKEVK